MKGLDWIKVSTNIGVDGDMEHMSDAAFRTYIELLAASSALLSDGRVVQRDARKRCNTRRLGNALAELSASGHVILDGDDIVLPKYGKWQCTREEVEDLRAKARERVTAYRQRNKAVTYDDCSQNVREQSKSQSKSNPSLSPPISPSFSPLVEKLVGLCRNKVPGWKPNDKDYPTVALGVERLGERGMEDLIMQLATYQAATNKYTALQRTLANWINRENPVAGGSRIDADDELDRMCRLTDELYEAKHAR
jgi:hypothetical protein